MEDYNSKYQEYEEHDYEEEEDCNEAEECEESTDEESEDDNKDSNVRCADKCCHDYPSLQLTTSQGVGY
jgi:hypothetical protein